MKKLSILSIFMLLVSCASMITYSFKDGNKTYHIAKQLAYTKEDAQEIAKSIVEFNYYKSNTPICSIDKNSDKNRYILDSNNKINLYQAIDLRNFEIPSTVTSTSAKNNNKKDSIISINFLTGEVGIIKTKIIFHKQKKERNLKLDLNTCVSLDSLSTSFSQEELDYKEFMESEYSTNLWSYYVLAHDLTSIVNKHNSYYVNTEKLTPYDLVEIHPYKTRNLTNEQKQEIKLKLAEFENQLPRIYYSSNNHEKKIIFNEIVKKYNNAYNKLK